MKIMISRRGFVAGTTALAALPITVGGPWPAAASAPRVLRIRSARDIQILDPQSAVGSAEAPILAATLPRLADWDLSEGIGWKPSEYVDALDFVAPDRIAFRLKPGFTWTNGHGPLTAADVKFSFERMIGSNNGGYFEQLDRVEVADDLAGEIILKAPFSPFIAVTLTSQFAHVVSEKAVTAAGGTFTTELPAVCGPYTHEFLPNRMSRLTANPEWTGPAPAFEAIEVLTIAENNAASLAFEAGELHCTDLSTEDILRYREGLPEGAGMLTAGSLTYLWLGMNTEHPQLADPRVRKAIQHAVDVDSIVEGVFGGVAEKAHGVVPPGLVGHREATGYGYDPAKARELLAEAGVSGLTLTLNTLAENSRVLTAQIIQANLAAVGITANVVPLESGPFWSLGSEADGDAWKDSQLWLMRYSTETDPFAALQWFVGDQVGIWNWERWRSEEFDTLFRDAAVEIDEEKRHAMYVRMQEIMEETGAYVFITHDPKVFVYADTIVPAISPVGEHQLDEYRPAAS